MVIFVAALGSPKSKDSVHATLMRKASMATFVSCSYPFPIILLDCIVKY